MQSYPELMQHQEMMGPMTGGMDSAPPLIQSTRLRIDSRKPSFSALWNRFTKHQGMYDLKEYDGEGDPKGSRKSRNLKTVTSNEPQVMANKLIRTVQGSTVHLRVPVAREVEQQRIANQAVKDFLMSAFRMADRRLKRYMKPSVMNQMAYQLVVRGWYAGRALLIRTPTGTQVDLTPWDPTNVLWDLGPNGLEWVCHLSSMTYAEIKAAHPGVTSYTTKEMRSEERYTVYDFYDRNHNMVFADGLDIKSMTLHGSPMIPAYVGYVGGMSPHSSPDNMTNGLEALGPSCYQSLERTYNYVNFGLSARAQMLAQSERPPVVVRSESGNKPLGGNIYEAGREFQLARTDNVEVLEFPNLGRDADFFTQMVMGEAQRGGLPHSAYGVTPLALSGTALESLRDDQESQVSPYVDGAQEAMQQIADILIEQYKTGRFEPLAIPGQLDAQNPQLVAMSDPVTVKISPNFRINMPVAATTAQILRDSELMSDAEIRAKVLMMEDEEGTQDILHVEQAEKKFPTVGMLKMFQAALQRGDMEVAQELVKLWMLASMELEGQMMMMQGQLAMTAQGGGEGGGPSPIPGGGMRGIAPNVAPQQALGMPTPAQPPRAGPTVSPGTPRPGAQGRNRSGALG